MTALSMDDLHRRVLALEERARAEDEAASAREESRPAHSSSNPYPAGLVNAAWWLACSRLPQEPPERLAVAYLKAKWRKESLRRSFGPLLSGASSRMSVRLAMREMLMPTRKPTTSQITSPTKATQQAECSVDERLRRFLQESAALVSHALTLQTSVVRERLQQPGTQETGEALPQPPPESPVKEAHGERLDSRITKPTHLDADREPAFYRTEWYQSIRKLQLAAFKEYYRRVGVPVRNDDAL